MAVSGLRCAPALSVPVGVDDVDVRAALPAAAAVSPAAEDCSFVSEAAAGGGVASSSRSMSRGVPSALKSLRSVTLKTGCYSLIIFPYNIYLVR